MLGMSVRKVALLVATVAGWLRGGTGFLCALVPGPLAEGLLSVVAFLILSRRIDRRSLLGAGSLIGADYLWRIDLGVSAVAGIVVFGPPF